MSNKENPGEELVKALNAEAPVGKVLHGALASALIARGNDQAKKESEPIAQALEKANRLLKQRDDLDALCGEMLGTLQIPGNREHVAKLGPIFQGLVTSWAKRYERCSGEPS